MDFALQHRIGAWRNLRHHLHRRSRRHGHDHRHGRHHRHDQLVDHHDGRHQHRQSHPYRHHGHQRHGQCAGECADRQRGGQYASGLDGNDTLTGGAGADNLQGGLGNDTYNIDATDTVVEAASAGTDTVNAGFTYTLLANFENLALTGTAVINGTGNALANVITGNAAANTLAGLDGNDTLNGGDGNDTLNGGIGNDALDGGTGTDILFLTGARASYTFAYIDGVNYRVTDARTGGDGIDTISNFESVRFSDGTFAFSAVAPVPAGINGTAGADTLNGTAGNDTINGLAGNDTINGGAGNDRISGGAGVDTMTGGVGTDTFVFADGDLVFGNFGPFGSPATDPDIITDFSGSNPAFGSLQFDKIDLSSIDANTSIAGNQAFTIFTPSGFNITAPAGSIRIDYVPGIGENPHYNDISEHRR